MFTIFSLPMSIYYLSNLNFRTVYSKKVLIKFNISHNSINELNIVIINDNILKVFIHLFIL